jgi:hypothetical protein
MIETVHFRIGIWASNFRLSFAAILGLYGDVQRNVMEFELGDRVMHRRPKHSFQKPSFNCGGTVVKGPPVTVKLDGNGGQHTYPSEVLELETPDPSREVKAEGGKPRIPFGARKLR